MHLCNLRQCAKALLCLTLFPSHPLFKFFPQHVSSEDFETNLLSLTVSTFPLLGYGLSLWNTYSPQEVIITQDIEMYLSFKERIRFSLQLCLPYFWISPFIPRCVHTGMTSCPVFWIAHLGQTLISIGHWLALKRKTCDLQWEKYTLLRFAANIFYISQLFIHFFFFMGVCFSFI